MRSRYVPTIATSLLLAALLALACTSTPAPQVTGYGTEEVVVLGAEGATSFDSSVPAQRVLIRSGRITVALDELDHAVVEVDRLVASAGGYVEQSNVARDSSVSISCRVPFARLEEIMDAIADLGDEQDRSISARDVTDEYADLETRLKNNRALRDRLQRLLDRATKVEDVLAIEKELNRVQSEVELMQGRLDRLKSQVELSPLFVLLERERILGPLGYLGYGLWWAVSKLFIIQ